MTKFAEEILANYGTQRIKDMLLDFPDRIEAQKKSFRTLRTAYSEADQDRKTIEVDLVSDISGEMDPATGKLKFSNEKARAAELDRRKWTNEEYILASKASRDAEHAMNEAQDRLDALQDKFKSYRYVARLVSEELALLATEEDLDDDDVRYVPTGKGIAAAGSVEPY